MTARRKRQLGYLLVLMLAGAAAELLSLGAVIPFVTVLADPARAAAIPAVAHAMAALGLAQADLPLAISIAFAALVLLATATRMTLMWASIRYTNGLGAEIACALYEKTLHRPYSFHVGRNTSEIIGSINKVQKAVVGFVQPLLTGAIALVLASAIVAILVLAQPWVAVIGATVFGASYFLIALRVRRRLRQAGVVIAGAMDKRIQAVQEGLGGIRDVILDRAQGIYTARFSRLEQRLRQAQASTQFLGGFPRLAIEAVGMLMLAGFAVALSGTGGDLVSLLPVLGILAVGAQKLLPLVQQIYNGWSTVISSQASVNDVLALLDFEPVAQQAHADISFTGSLRLEGVGFRYEGTPDDAWVLDGINLEIRRGEKIGIAGATGSGKSTLVDLLMGLLSPTRGRFEVDGVEVTPSNAASWQRHIAHVPQSIFLSDASIAENIAFGIAPGQIDQGRLEAAARAAQIHEHIATLPQGYRTPVGERGVRLSGGQRQRIGIARALYKQVDVLVLDEATSALDDETETRVMAGISAAAGGMTVIMIAHRITTLAGCDRIIELSHGRLAGSHDYASLVRKSAAAD